MKPERDHSRVRGRLLLAAALALATQMASAATPAVTIADAHARGLSVLGADATPRADGYTVRTRVSRSLMSGILSPVALKVVVRDAAGEVKAEGVTALGPAELPRRRLRAFRFDTQLDVAPADGDTIEVKLEG